MYEHNHLIILYNILYAYNSKNFIVTVKRTKFIEQTTC